MSFSKRMLDPEGYGSPPVTVCCGVIPRVEGFKFTCPACGKNQDHPEWKGVRG